MSNTHQKATPTTENLEIETHPFEPWLPKDAHLLILLVQISFQTNFR